MTWPLSGSPDSRTTFKEYCLRRLGAPVIEINVSPEQVDDRVDDALKYWTDFHCDASEKLYYKYQLVSDDFTNKYITMPDNVIGAIRIFEGGFGQGSGDILNNVPYQIFMSELYNFQSVDLLPYYMTMQKLGFIQDILVGKRPIRYNRHSNRLYIDMNWSRFNVGDFLIIECYNVIDPDVFTDAWGDRWLQQYATALVKRQWGSNLTKFIGMKMPGEIVFNGQKIYDDAVTEIAQLEKDMINSYSLPVSDMIG